MPAVVSPCHVLADLALGCCGTTGLDVTCPLDALCISGEESVLRAVEAGQELWLLLSGWCSQMKPNHSGLLLCCSAFCHCGCRYTSHPLSLLTSA